MAVAFFESFSISGWGVLVHLAAITQVIGYLIRDQFWLRLMLLIGTVFYMAYYWLYPDVPLWDAIFWSTMLGLANLVGILLILRDRTWFRMSTEEEALYTNFDYVQPGDFRRLMKIANFREAADETVLTEEGVTPDELYFVVEGVLHLKKANRSFDYEASTFIGELSMVTSGTAVATVRLTKGSRYVAWNRDALAKLLKRRPSMKLALDLLVTRDMARKVQDS